VSSLDSLKNDYDISVTIRSYEGNQKQTLLGLQNKKTGHCFITPQTTSRSTGRARGLANRIFLEAEGYD
jgi:hypothetical protein